MPNPELLHVGDRTFDPDDLTYGEKRAVRRLIRTEIWDEALDGEWSWDEIGPNEVIPATICVFMRREDPNYTLDQAMAVKPRDAWPDDEDDGAVPPTGAVPAPVSAPASSSPRASARKKASVTSGSPA